MARCAPSFMPWVESMAFKTDEAAPKTALWALTSTTSSEASSRLSCTLPPFVMPLQGESLPVAGTTRIVTSAKELSSNTVSQVATTSSCTGTVGEVQQGRERMSTASSTAFSSSVQSASSLGSWVFSLMERLAASKHSKADLPAKLIGFMLSPPLSPPHHLDTSHCFGATMCGSAPERMAKRRSSSLAFRSAWSALMRSSNPLFNSFVSDSSSWLTMSLPKRMACSGEPNES
mmetsp:Transcript_25452/g.85141  ORF Transcript_25452/g.85141 Transcript_25452/m.85141 type:complete len:232 (-) Transcript_25452:193-888(-)